MCVSEEEVRVGEDFQVAVRVCRGAVEGGRKQMRGREKVLAYTGGGVTIENVAIYVAQVVEVGREEDVKVALQDEVGCHRDHGTVEARLDDGRIDALKRVRERVKVGHDESVMWEVAFQLLQQPERVGGDKHGWRQVREERRMGSDGST